MDVKQFKMPDIGEGLTEADILGWRVAVGDVVEVNQVLVEVETAKAAVELPSPFAGVVTALHATEGQTVNVGAAIISIEVAAAVGAAPTAASAPALAQADVAPAAAGTAPPDAAVTNLVPTPAAEPADGAPYGVLGEGVPKRQPVLVGYGPAAEGTAHRRRRRPVAPAPSAHPAFAAGTPDGVPPEVPPDVPSSPVMSAPTDTAVPATDSPANGLGAPHPAPTSHRVLAKPPVRKLAKSLGVDLAGVRATGPNGTVSRDDVAHAAQTSGGPAAGTGTAGSPTGAPGPQSVRARGARETRVPIRGVRKHTAAAMVSSAFTAPHVTEFVTIDITATMDLRERVAARRDFVGVKVSPLLFVARAVILAAERTPEINASWDEAAGEIVLKHYVNLGIAAATDRGLVVPNITDADALGLRDLADAITRLTDTARAGRTSPADMLGGTITITNVGVFGIDTGTPILNPGETGIVAFGAIRRMPWVVGGPDGTESIEPRWVTQLAVSFDHRVVDGQQGSQFLSDVAGMLADPGLAML